MGPEDLRYYFSIPYYSTDFILSSALLTWLVSSFFVVVVTSGGIGNCLFPPHAVRVMVRVEGFLATPFAAGVAETVDTAPAFCASLLMGLMCF